MSNHNGLSRRDLLKGAVAIGAGLASSTLPTAALAGPAPLPTKWDDEADVIVIGGGTGMMAAIAAADAGARTIVLEKMPKLGGDSSINGGVFYAGGTSVQKAAGITDSVDKTFEDWMRAGKYEANSDLVKQIVQAGPGLVDWFAERGLKFTLYQSGLDPIKRGHLVIGSSGHFYTDVLIKEMDSRKIPVYTDTKALEILRDDAGKLIGVKAQSKDSSFKYYGTKTVILATGGTAFNLEMIMRYNPETIKWAPIGGSYGTGDGITMADKLNARFVGLGNAEGGAGGFTIESLGLTDQITVMTQYMKAGKPRAFVYVDKYGKRYADETAGYLVFRNIIATYAAAVPSYGIFDQTVYDDPDYVVGVGGTKKLLGEAVTSGKINKADTIADLAKALLLDEQVLKQTVDKYNALVKAGKDDDWGRPANTLGAIAQAPFYGFKAVPGGREAKIYIDVNNNCQVLDRDGCIIPGVYAMTALIAYLTIGAAYPGSGSYCAAGFALGRVAGQHAAATAKASSKTSSISAGYRSVG